MAYVSQANKLSKAPAIKAILKKYGIKGSLAISNHMTLVLNVKSGSIDFMEDHYNVCSEILRYSNPYHDTAQRTSHISVNPYHFERQHSGTARDFLREVIDVMNIGNHDDSDVQTDYFDVGWYIDVNIGKWNKPYILVK
jgi:hypothetical protein